MKWTWDKHLKRIFGHLIAEAVNPHDLEAYTRIRKATKVSNRTVNKELSLFSGFLSWAADRKRAYITPRSFKPEFLSSSRPKPIVLTLPEALKIANAAKPVHRALILAFYTLGLRFGEARLLTWEDCDLENRVMRTIQKGGTYKVLPMTKLLAESLEALKPAKKRKGFIFVNPRTGKPYTDIRKSLQTATAAAKVNKRVYPHLFRHSVATYGVGKNINLRSIQGFLGHSDSRVTEWYTHVNTEHLEAISSQLDRDAEALPAVATTVNTSESKKLSKLSLRKKSGKMPESQPIA
jgi:site-specific recombinase XerD